MIYKFLEYELDTDVQELRKAGVACAIEPQVFDLLFHLIVNRDRLVSRDELFETIWHGRIVSDATLSSRVKAARKVVGDTGKKQAVIQTLPRRGFRFVATVDDRVGSTVEEPTSLSAVDDQSEALKLPDKPSIAVLPFNNLSGDPEQEYFADGMVEDIIAALSKFSWLFVIARNSTFAYKGQSVDVRDISRDLGVRYVLEGSVRRMGARLRVAAQLVDASIGSHIWAERYDRDVEDLFLIQDEVASAIAGAIAPEIDLAEFDRAKRKPPENLDCWSLLQKGQLLYGSGEAADMKEAVSYFMAARKADPNFVDATALTAHALFRTAFHFPSENNDEILRQAEELLQEARRQDSRNLINILAQGWFHLLSDEPILAVASAREAVARNSNWALAYHELGFFLARAEQYEECLETLDIADRLSPRDPRISGRHTMRAACYFYLGKFAQSAEWARRAIYSQYPRFWVDVMLIAALHRLGDSAGVMAAKQRLFKRKPDFTLQDVELRFAGKMLEALEETDLPR